MRKRLWIGLVLSLLLAIFTAAMAFGIAPRVLVITGPALCESGSHFVLHEGPTIDLPDNQRGAPAHMSCVSPDGRQTAPHLGRAFTLFFAGVWAAWGLAVWSLVRRIPVTRPK